MKRWLQEFWTLVEAVQHYWKLYLNKILTETGLGWTNKIKKKSKIFKAYCQVTCICWETATVCNFPKMQPVLSPFFHLLYVCGGNSGLLPLQAVSKSIIVLFLVSVVLLGTVMTLDQSSPALSTTSMTREATTSLPNAGIRSSCNSRSCSSQVS